MYGLPYCVTWSWIIVDPESLSLCTNGSRVPGLWDPGSTRILGKMTQFQQNILSLCYNVVSQNGRKIHTGVQVPSKEESSGASMIVVKLFKEVLQNWSYRGYSFKGNMATDDTTSVTCRVCWSGTWAAIAHLQCLLPGVLQRGDIFQKQVIYSLIDICCTKPKF